MRGPLLPLPALQARVNFVMSCPQHVHAGYGRPGCRPGVRYRVTPIPDPGEQYSLTEAPYVLDKKETLTSAHELEKILPSTRFLKVRVIEGEEHAEHRTGAFKLRPLAIDHSLPRNLTDSC